jgi:NAD(P)-dependent dehydrogenase (short-subunit alcohol dehydrogenase family)
LRWLSAVEGTEPEGKRRAGRARRAGRNSFTYILKAMSKTAKPSLVADAGIPLGLSDLFSVKDKVVVITGCVSERPRCTPSVPDHTTTEFFSTPPPPPPSGSGASGIGLMFSSGFVQNGARVYITSRKASECEKVAADLSAKGPGKCFALAEDLATLAGIASFARRLKAAGEDKVHVLINNSGVSWGQPMMEFQEKGWDQVFALNVKSVFYMTREMLPFLEKAASREHPAHVINIGSIAGITGQAVPTYSYDASKAAVHHLTKKLASDLAPSNICVNAIAPGVLTHAHALFFRFTRSFLCSPGLRRPPALTSAFTSRCAAEIDVVSAFIRGCLLCQQFFVCMPAHAASSAWTRATRVFPSQSNAVRGVGAECCFDGIRVCCIACVSGLV